jgi:hypothetical protein
MRSPVCAALYTRFERTRSKDDLECSITTAEEEAASLLPNYHPNLPLYLNSLAISLRDRFQETDNVDDVNRAITLQEEALALTANEQLRAMFLNNLGYERLTWFHRIGSIDDLDVKGR